MSDRDDEIEFLREQIAALEQENRDLRSTSSSKTEQRATEHYRNEMVKLADEVKRLRKENEDLQIDLGSANAMIQTEFG